MELTKEYLDQVVSHLAAKDDLAGLATKTDLVAAEVRLKEHAENLQVELARMIENTVDVTNRVARLESDINAIKRALKLA